WASHEDNYPFYGWVVGFNAATLAIANVLNVSPSTHWSGIWMSGGAPSADANNNIYVITGNGAFDVTTGGNDYGDSFLQMSGSLAITSYFTPTDQETGEPGADNDARQKLSLGRGIFATGAFWNNNFYIAGVSGPLVSYSFNSTTNLFNNSVASQSSTSYGFPGSSPSVSATGSSNGIVWALDNANYCTA